MPTLFGEETFIDGVDPVSDFYARLQTAEKPPSTSTPSPGSFVEAYRRLAEGASAIVSLHVMGTKSTIVNAARLAAAMVPNAEIHVVDSQTTTLGLGLLAMAAAKAAQMGQAVADVTRYVERLIPQVDCYAAIRELTELRRSGRVSLGQALLAGVLNIKPIIEIGHGVVEVADKVRSWPRAVERTLELIAQRVGEARVTVAVVHTNAEAEARQLLERVRAQLNCVETMVAEAGSALASHAGPGAVGIVTMQME